MENRHMRITWVLVAALMGFGTMASANDSETERASLTGLTSLSVVVEDLAAAAGKSGLAGAVARHRPGEWLRQAGISLTPDSDAYLYVRVTVGDPGGSLPLAYVVDVSLMQTVTLPRGLKTRTPLQCPTWWVNNLGMSGADRIRVVVTDRVGEFADQFVRAYRSVNPLGK
jgi:hypothetical protein